MRNKLHIVSMVFLLLSVGILISYSFIDNVKNHQQKVNRAVNEYENKYHKTIYESRNQPKYEDGL